MNGALVFVKNSGKVVDAGLPDCPTYASGLLWGRFLPAIATDLLNLLSRGNLHKPFFHDKQHAPESFVAYLQHGTVLGKTSAAGSGITGGVYPERAATAGVVPRIALPKHAVMMLPSYFEPDGQQRGRTYTEIGAHHKFCERRFRFRILDGIVESCGY